jgi:rhomboid protease GluP
MIDQPAGRPGRDTPHQGRYWPRYWPTVLILAALICAIELLLDGADRGLWGTPSWRRLSFFYFAFQPWVLKMPQGLWPGQAFGMFVTHMFLHVDFWHMAKNMLAFMLLAFLLRKELSLSGLLLLCLVSGLGGAVLFLLIGSPYMAMTGASGALSGLSAVWALGNAPGQIRADTRQIVLTLAAVVALILLIEALPGSKSAWEAHLGGALTGAGFVLLRRGRGFGAPD